MKFFTAIGVATCAIMVAFFAMFLFIALNFYVLKPMGIYL